MKENGKESRQIGGQIYANYGEFLHQVAEYGLLQGASAAETAGLQLNDDPVWWESWKSTVMSSQAASAPIRK